LETSNTLNDGRTVSFHKAQKQPASLYERPSMTELRVICTRAGDCRMPTSQLNGLIPKCKNSEHQDYESICIQEPKISQYVQYTVAHDSSGTFSTMCHNISVYAVHSSPQPTRVQAPSQLCVTISHI